MKNPSENQIKSLPKVWHCAGGDCSRRALFPEKVKIKGKPGFTLELSGGIQSSPVFDSNGNAYIGDTAGTIAAFSNNGNFIWKTKVDSGIFCSPVVHPLRPVLYAATVGGFLYAINTETVQIIWKKQIPTKSDPRILSDLLYVQKINAVVLSSWGGRFLAIDVENGNEKFSWNAGISPSSAASADLDGNIYTLRALEGIGVELVKVSPDGKETPLFRQEENRRGARRTLVRACPVIDESGKMLYFVANLDRGAILYAYSLTTNAVLWKSVLPVSVQASPIILVDGSVAVFDLRGMVVCFGSEGIVKYHYQTESDYLLAPGVSEITGTVFVGDVLGRLRAIDETGKGKVLFESSRSIQASPSFSPNGDLYLTSTDHNVYVFKNVSL